MNEIKVTIITPLYNAQEYISETIDSVLSQTFLDWELILIDDCSSDNTYNYVVEKYSHISNIKILKNGNNSGAGFTRNRGLEIAQGRYIAFLDSDDLWLPDKLQVQIDFMNKNNAPISHTSFTFINESSEPRIGYVKVSSLVDLVTNLKKTEIGTSTALIDTDIVGKDFKFSMLRARQDLVLWLELLGRGHNSFGLDKPLVKYRIRSGQISGNKFKMLIKSFKVYMQVSNIPLFYRIYYFCCYALNASLKRLRSK